MCSVIGYLPSQLTDLTEAARTFRELVRESRARGTHAFGLAQPLPWGGFDVVRSHDPWKIADAFDGSRAAVAHARYSTSGDWRDHGNNQPIVLGELALVFNGVIDMGTREEMETRHGMTLESENDGEIFLRLAARLGARAALTRLEELTPSFAGLVLTSRGDVLALRNERRPLWTTCRNDALWWASTRDIFLRAGFQDAEELAEVST